MSGSKARIEYMRDAFRRRTYTIAKTVADYHSKIDIDETAPVIRSVSIICTIGPTSQKKEQLEQLIDAGMTIARLNFSHGTHEYHQATIENVRAAAVKSFPHPIAIALDTKGPEIRTGMMKDGKDVTYQKGQALKVSCDPAMREQCDENLQYLEYPSLCKSVKPGGQIFIADGMLILEVKEILNDKCVMTEVQNLATIGSRKNCNLPGAIIDLPAVSEKDRSDLLFGVEQEVDMVFASFIRKKEDIFEIRDVLGDKGKDIKIIAKVENHEGIKNIDEIVEFADGVMVARGDMGMEIPLEKVFLAQKLIISKCNQSAKPVICATQMLESMIKNPRPTRAEITDVGNAVTDGCDCVMLSGESANGAYPVEAVTYMHKICKEAASAMHYEKLFHELTSHFRSTDIAEITAMSAVNASFKVNAAAIIVLTTSGRSAAYLSHFCPDCPVIAITRNAKVARKLHLYRGIFPLEFTDQRKLTWTEDIDARLDFGIQLGLDMGFILPDSNVIFVSGYQPGSSTTNTMRILTVDGENIVGHPEHNITFK